MKHAKKHNAGLIEIFCGAGKCLAMGTKMLVMGMTKVENIKVGDKLMGDDSQVWQEVEK